ncbi:MATH and LRR domain-containing protein PFE0570w isoform X3 [Bicyclus anynana]|uniref:MATH and LRR domain-containing protein PFE0570w isoform X3 n=1 Tax=Bicyclus anynana TaxID=110368 RepID=A0ABM3LHM5_BICAN|nr:MATH and LRR domain-containing protein PFE0570w isoform X3 [Bicyclus anynana]
MEEDAGVKAPVTRLRRRLSVEQTEESKSPAVSTPTKKRGGRKAAKPELELIDENTPTNTTTRKATTKTTTKDVVEPEEKNLTPARRTTRIKSNTSIISETALAVESPRAKRAARRASTTGSDYEAAVTPIRQTRRTRKDSTSSIEKEPQQPPPKQEIQITEVIIEEPDSITTVKSTPQPEKTPSTNPRKSPRLLEKINKTSPGKVIEQSSDESKPATNHSKNSADSISISQQEPTDNSKRDSETSQDALSTVSDSIIKEVNTTPKKSKLRKSFSSAESKENLTKRNRTKSWTNLSASSNSKLYSDNENAQNGIINDLKTPLVILNNVSSIHSSSNASLNQDQNIADKSISSPKKKDCVNLQVENIDVPDKTNSIQNKNKTESETVSLDKYMNTKQQSKDALASEIFKKNPSRDMKVTLFIEDTPDSNSDKINLQTSHDNEDQCVPEVVHPVETFQSELNSFSSTLDKQNMLNKSKEPRDNDCEPMDIDETIPENLIMAGAQTPEKNTSSIKLSSTNLHTSNLTTEEMENVSRRQSSIIQSLNKSEIATKSTLILSQIKDSPTGVVNNLGKSLQVSNNELLSQSVDDLNITQESDVKKKLSLHYSTSTPLQDKNIQKLKGIQVNTSIIAMQNNDSKNIINHVGNLSKNQYENLSDKNDSVASHDGNLKDTLKRENSERNTDTSKNKGKGRNSSKKYIENEMIHSSEDEKMYSEKDKSIDNHTNISINDKKVCTSQNKSKSADIPSEEKHINESDDDNAETSSLRNEVFNASGNYKPEEKDIKSDMVNSSQNEKMESDGDTSIDNNTNINLSDKNACKLENESKSADLLSEKQNTSSESEEEYESDEDSVEKSNLLDDEAFDAGDDYESGDSQDDSERQFEKENEIIDKGVTLTSEEEFSDDSDYEKDSFLVSSNEEDNELLDGSDDDLSMSDNELKMTTTSKKKFNERKVKEQKKASREMFESRHKLNSSKNSSNASILSATKNKKRLQISSSESEEDIPAKPKKYNRLRLDSTKEASLLNDESEHKISKKKNRHLPDTSSSDESIPKEKEITICDETIKESDPLSQIKTEPKTPIKSANSSIAFMDTENVNNDEIDKNESTMTQIEVDDPLQATMAADDESLSSDNENIMQNYDSVLQDLNKNKNSKVKACDISLNLDNKKKKTAKVALVDELNLTQLKSPRRTKSKHTEEVNNSAEEMLSNTAEDASSDSIDLHLLFSEDSNSSETSALQNKMKTANDDSEVFIPLKKTEAKTDIRESKDEEQSMEVSFNQSIVKANKRKSQQHESTSSGDEHPSFFIDTVGTLGDPSDKTHDDSLKINKKQSTENSSFAMEKSVNKSVSNAKAQENSEDDSPLEISYKKEKKRSSKVADVSSVAFEKDTNDKMSNSKTPSSEKKKKNKSMDANISVQATEDLVADQTINKSILKTPGSEKKHKKKSMDANITVQEDCVADKTVNKSITKTPASGKKRKKKSMDADDILEQADSEAEQTINKSTNNTPGSEKKLKKKSIGAELVVLEDTTDVAVKTLNKSIAKTPNSEKKHKNKSMNVDISEQADYVADKTINKSITEMPGSEKKRKKKSMNADISEQAETTDVADKTHNKSIAKTPNSEKKHKKKSMNADISEQADSVTDTINKSITEIPDSEKKQRKSVNADISEQADPVADKTLNKSIAKTPASEKKLKNKSMDAESSEQADIVCDSTENKSTSKISNSEKQNKHQSGSHAGQNDEITENTEISSKKRKRQSSLNTTKEEIHPTDVAEVLKDSLGNEKKKRKIATEDATATVSVEITVKRNRKRKEPEQDVPSNQTKKMVKEAPVFNKVPRLPSTVLKQLDNAPDKQVLNQKPEVISTTQFLVQEAKRRKTKPSNYLEESIYLNDHTENTRNVKKRLEKPKVLPFVPTASTSSSGFTTNFKINVVPNEFKFVAQSNSVSQSFKDNYLYGPKIKRVGTYDLHKRRRNIKLSKF